MKRDDIPFLSQLIKSMIEAEPKLEQAYGKKNAENLNKTKAIMLEIQKKISDIIKT